MTHASKPTERGVPAGAAPPLSVLWQLGAWLGIAYGLFEGLEVSALRLIPGVLSWRTGNSSNVLWFAPLFYGVAFTAFAVVISFVSLLKPSLRWDGALVFLLLFAGGFLALTLPGQPLSDLAAAALAIGVATELTRQYWRRRASLTTTVRRTLPYLAGLVLLLAAAMVGLTRVREKVGIAKLVRPAGESPNVLLLIIDTQRADHLSSYGYSRPTSPNLDRFAQGGVLFEKAYASSSWTLPTHATLMTGRQLHEHRAGVMRRPYLDDRYPTLAETLAAAGYATGGFVANTFWAGRQTGLSRGFMRYEDFWGNLGDAIARTALGRRLAYDVLPRYGFIDVPGRKYATEINEDLLRWIDGVDGRPFFAFVNYFDVHGPYLPRAPHAGTFAEESAYEEEKKIEIGALTEDVIVPPQEKLQYMIDRYDESILSLDEQLGRLFTELERRGVLANTLIIVTSDHGESWGEHGMMYHGHSLYHEQLHVPLIVHFPGRVPAGIRETRSVGVQQIPKTIAEFTGLAGEAFPGRSLFAAHDSVDAAPILAEVAQRSMVAANWPSSRGWVASLLTDQWQFMLFESGEFELFDLIADPGQTRNLAGDPAGMSTATAMRSMLGRTPSAQGLDWRK